MIKKIFVLCGVVLILVACNGVPTLPPVAVDINQVKNNNHRNYNTYTMFFSARSIGFSESELNKEEFLKRSFNMFAESIGKNNAATWIGSNTGYDVKSSKNICDLYSLPYSGGPYIIFSKENPILAKKKQEEAVILDFSSVNSNRIRYVLSELEQNIRRKQYTKVNQYQINKQIVLSTYENNIDFVKDVIVAILGK